MKDLQLMFAQSSIVFELQHYRFHSAKVEELLTNEMIKLREEHDEMTKDWPAFDRAEFFENAHDDYWELGTKFPEIQRTSSVISVYSVLENSLNR
ncbi:hypothetical protein [Vibrio gigantis]|uniref:hypothetical protein n=1 Tax=Vibrio gigantis TaxID=296199 RepID=UPI001BFE9863|nr:hypothetical protein [Vibrio gigantis]